MESNFARAFCLFVAAMVSIILVAGFICLIADLTVVPPSPLQAAKEANLISAAIVQPKSVERLTFTASTAIGLLIIALGAYFASRKTFDPTRFVVPAIVVSFLVAFAGLCFMQWDSIVPPTPDALLQTVRAHPILFPSLLLPCAAVLYFLSLQDQKRAVRALLFLTCVSFFLVISSLVIFGNDDGYTVTTHFEVFVYPLVQDWLGQAIFINQKSQYGDYPIFLRPVWELLGTFNMLAVSSVMSLLLFVSNLFTTIFIFRFGCRKTLVLMFCLAGITFSLLFYPFWPGDAYFPFFPVRLLFPAVAMLLIVVSARRMQYAELAYLPLAFGLIWNFESGVVGLAMFATFVAAVRFKPSWRAALQLALRQSAAVTISVLLAYFVVREYYEMRFGVAPSVSEQLRSILAFSVGVGSLPMPVLGAWVFHLLIYAIAIFAGVHSLFRTSSSSPERQASAAMMSVAVMGLLWFRYYEGRSHALPLAFITFPAIFCLGFLADMSFRSAAATRRPLAGLLAAAVGAPVITSVFLYAASDPLSARGLAAYQHRDVSGPDVMADRVIDQFNAVRLTPSDRLFVVSPYAYLVALKLGAPNPLGAAGHCQIWFNDELDTIVASVADANTKMFAYDTPSGNSCALNAISRNDRVAAVLNAQYDRIPVQGCSVAPADKLELYVRKDRQGARALADETLHNIAVNKSTMSSSSLGGTSASAAVDGNTDGRFDHGSTTHSLFERNPWWQVDLGESADIARVTIWNRTDCCSERLRHYWVFSSDNPIASNESLDELKRRPDVFKRKVDSLACPNESLSWNQTRARYVRVQLEGEGYLSLAEVQIFSPSKTFTDEK